MIVVTAATTFRIGGQMDRGLLGRPIVRRREGHTATVTQGSTKPVDLTWTGVTARRMQRHLLVRPRPAFPRTMSLPSSAALTRR